MARRPRGLFEPDEAYAQYPKLERHRAFLPERVDLSHRFPTPGDQGDQGSCVGWAVGYAARSYYAVAREGRPRNQIGEIPSPAYIYGAIKPAGDCDTGSLITRALSLLSSDGALSMARYPYNHRQCPAPNRVASPQFRIANWRALNVGVIDDAKGALAKGHPVIIGARMTKDFIRLRGDVVWRGEGERISGGHAMTLLGYDERRQAFKVINSWGVGTRLIYDRAKVVDNPQACAAACIADLQCAAWSFHHSHRSCLFKDTARQRISEAGITSGEIRAPR
jgi:C1A family cysteine protease